MLHIRLLGPPLIERDNQPLRIQRRIPRAMLFYLAALGGPVARGELLFLFWPEEDEEKAREHLRDNLAKLRAALPDPDLVQTSAETVGLDFERLRVDVREFRRLVDQSGILARKASNSGLLPAASYYALTDAVRLWRSPNFLAGASLSVSAALDEWSSRTDHVLQASYQHAVERLADHELAAGNGKRAIEWLQRALEIDPYNEDLHYRLLIALVDMGSRPEALRRIADLRILLLRELGLEPSDSIRNLEQRLQKTAGPPSSMVKAAWPIRPSVQAPYVGQGENLARLQAAFRKGGGVIIFGEGGAGKTRLVQEFYQDMKIPPRLLLGSCRPTETNLPYQPWIEMLRHNVSQEEWSRLPAVWAAHLSLILPELISLRADLVRPPEAGSDQMRAALFEAVRILLVGLAAEWPVLLFFDNVHWGDDASLDILAYLLEHGIFANNTGLLVMAARAEENNPFLDRLLLSSSPGFRLQSIEVDRLGEEEIAELSHHVLGRRPPQGLVERLAMDTGGNPFFLLETLQALLDSSPDLDLEMVDALPLVSSVHQLIQSRLRQLSEPTQELLMAAAVLGNEFDVNVLEKVALAAPEQVARGLEELEARRLLQSTADNRSLSYTFVHEKIRESLLQEISPARKRLLHTRVAHALAEHFSFEKERFAAVLAAHYEEARSLPEAFTAWVQAGQYAQRLSSFADAANAFGRAERLIPRTISLGDEPISRLYTEWGEMLYELNDVVTLRRIHQTLVRLATDRRSDLLMGKALDGLAEACFIVNQFADGLEYADQALLYLNKSDDLYSRMEALTHRGIFLSVLNRIEEAQDVFRDALELAPAADDPLLLRARGHANYRLATTYIITGWPQEALRYGEQSLQDYKRAGRAFGQVMTHVVLSMANYSLGEYANGRLIAVAGIELAGRIAAWRMLGDLHICRAHNEIELDEFGPAWESAQQALALGIKHEHSDIVASAYRACGDIYRNLGDCDLAVNMYKRGFEVGAQHYVAIDNLMRMGSTLLQKGEAIGDSYFQQAVRRAADLHLGMLSFHARGQLLLLQLGQERFAEAAAGLDSYRQEAQVRGWKPSLLLAEYAEAALARSRGDLDEAEMRCRNLVQAGHALGCPRLELRALLLLARLLREQRRPIRYVEEHVAALLEQMERGLGGAPLRESWEKYCNTIRESLR